MKGKTVRKRIGAAVQAMQADVASWVPRTTRWPKVGQQVKLVGNHPWRGCSGEVIGFQVLGLFPEEDAKPRVRLENGEECFITQPHEWEAA